MLNNLQWAWITICIVTVFIVIPARVNRLVENQQRDIVQLQATIAQQQHTIDRMNGVVRHATDIVVKWQKEREDCKLWEHETKTKPEEPLTEFTWPGTGVATSSIPVETITSSKKSVKATSSPKRKNKVAD